MKKFIVSFFLLCILTQSFGQTKGNLSMYLQGQYNKIIYDRILTNNPWGLGLGLQLIYNKKSKVKPVIDLTADAYLEDDKVFRTNVNGTEIIRVGGMVNVFMGASYHPIRAIYLSLVTGPSFVRGGTFLGVKPSLGFYFSQNQRWTGKFSYINVFNRDKVSEQDFGSLSFSFGVRFF